MLLLLSVSLFYGTGLPVLYQIALVGFIIQYIMDRLLVCYFYREPPCYDDAMTQLSIKLMKYIGLISLLGSWYQLSTHKIFETDPHTVHKNLEGPSAVKVATQIDEDPIRMTYQDGPLFLFCFVFTYFGYYWVRKYVFGIDDSGEDKYAKI